MSWLLVVFWVVAACGFVAALRASFDPAEYDGDFSGPMLIGRLFMAVVLWGFGLASAASMLCMVVVGLVVAAALVVGAGQLVIGAVRMVGGF